MAHLVLQDVDPRVIESLGARAGRHGRSVEEEARAVLEGALGFSRQRALEGARRVRAQWAGRPLTASGELMAQDGDGLSAEPGGGQGGGGGGGEKGD
jgi:plasmid stability protein